MALTFTQDKGTLTAHLSGDIDHQVARGLMLALDREVAARCPGRLTVDMGGVSFMDSSGIAVLLRGWKRMGAAGGHMTVTAVPPQAGKVFAAAGLDKIIPMTS